MNGKDVRNAHDTSFVDAVRMRINLTERQFQILDYRYVKGYMAAKIANILCISIDTVYHEYRKIDRKLAFIDLKECEELAKQIKEKGLQCVQRNYQLG